MGKERIQLSGVFQKIVMLISTIVLITLSVYLLYLWLSSVDFRGIIGIIFAVLGLFSGYYSFFCDKIIFDFERKIVFYPGIYSMKKISLELIDKITLVQKSYEIVQNQICFNLISGEKVFCRGYHSWYSKKVSKQKTGIIIQRLNNLRRTETNGDENKCCEPRKVDT